MQTARARCRRFSTTFLFIYFLFLPMVVKSLEITTRSGALHPIFRPAIWVGRTGPWPFPDQVVALGICGGPARGCSPISFTRRRVGRYCELEDRQSFSRTS